MGLRIIQDSMTHHRVLHNNHIVGTIVQCPDTDKWRVETIAPNYQPQRFRNFDDAVQVFGQYRWKSYVGSNRMRNTFRYEPHRPGVYKQRWALS